jgi:hypothetical protein
LREKNVSFNNDDILKEQKNSGEKRGKQVLCGHDDHAGYIYKFMQ